MEAMNSVWRLIFKMSLQMRTKSLITVILIIGCLDVSAQGDTNKLSIDFGYGINSYSMGSVNQFIDTLNTTELTNKITSGEQFRLGINYQPIGLFNLSIYGSYQYGNSSSPRLLIETDEWGSTIQEHKGTFELRTEAMGLGLASTWYISHLLKFHEKDNVLNRLHFGLELNGGIGFSNATTSIRYPTLPYYSGEYSFSSQDFQGQIGLKATYDFTKSPLSSSLGIRGGYQFFKTKTLKDRSGKEWVVHEEHPINLDFTGFYFGAYIMIGK